MKSTIQILVIIVLLGWSPITFGQNKIAKKAKNEGKNIELVYEAIAGANSFITPNDLERWERRNRTKYMLLGKEISDLWFAGCKRTLVTKFSFIEKNDFEKYKAIKAENERQRILAEQERKKVDAAVSATGLAVFGAIIGSAAKGIKEHVNNFGKYNTPQYDNSINENNKPKLEDISGDEDHKTDNYDVDYMTIPIPEISSKSRWKDAGNGSNDEVCDVCFGEPLVDGFLCAVLIRDKNKYYTKKSYFLELEYDTEEQALRALYILKRYDKVIKY